MTTAIRIESDEAELDGLEVPLGAGEPQAGTRQGGEKKRRREVTLQWWQAVAVLVGVAALIVYAMWPESQARVMEVRQLTRSGQTDPWGKLGDRREQNLFCCERRDWVEPDADFGGRRKHPENADAV